MYDVNHDKSVSKQELATLINQIPKDVLLASAMIPDVSRGENGFEELAITPIAEDEGVRDRCLLLISR